MDTNEDAYQLEKTTCPEGFVYLGYGCDLPRFFHPFDGIVYRTSVASPHWDKTVQTFAMTYKDEHSRFSVVAESLAGKYLIATRDDAPGDPKAAAREVFQSLQREMDLQALRIDDLKAQTESADEVLDEIKARHKTVIKAASKFLKAMRDEEYKIPEVILQDDYRDQRGR